MQAVRPDQQVVAFGPTIGEGDIDAGLVRGEIGHRPTEVHDSAGLLGPLDEDAGEVGAVHPHGRRELRTARALVGDLGDDRRLRPGSAQPKHVEAVPLGLDLLPDAELVEHAQGIALQGDARAEGRQARLGLEDVDDDALLGEQDGGCGSSDSATGDCDSRHSSHGGPSSRGAFRSGRWG